MTATTPTADRPLDTLTALLLACRDHPEEDTPRLALADYYDEHDEPERAELVRVSVELARIVSGGTADPKRYIDPATMEYTTPPDFERWKVLDCREHELPAALGERLSAPCPACGAEGGWSGGPACPTCEGSGDLLRVTMRSDGARPHRWLRGCLYLDVRLEEVCRHVLHVSGSVSIGGGTPSGETSRADDWQPTPWATALPPEVVGLWVTDREPHWNGATHAFYREGRRHPSSGVPDSAVLPGPVFDAIERPGVDVFGRLKGQCTPYLARLHLAHALRRFAAGVPA